MNLLVFDLSADGTERRLGNGRKAHRAHRMMVARPGERNT